MNQQSNQSSPASCLKDKLADTEKKANEAEFHKQTAAMLKDLIAKSDKELNAYRGSLPGLMATWKEQDEKIQELKKHLESCYPQWECYLKQSVCKDVICKNWWLRKSYESTMGAPELRLEYANADKDKATKQLEAWKTLSTWIQRRLSDNKSLYDRICALDNCLSPLLQLYLFYFILWPQHRQLCKSPRQLAEKESYPEHAYCSEKCQPPKKDCTCLVGYPWIIDPENFDCQLTLVWQAWSDAGIRETKARSAFEQIAKDKEEYKKSSTPEAVEKAAAEALVRFDRLENKPCPEEPPCGQQSDDSEDPCQIDPCKLDEEQYEEERSAEEKDPCSEDAPGVCEETDPCEEPVPEPCEEPEPKPDEAEPCDDQETAPSLKGKSTS